MPPLKAPPQHWASLVQLALKPRQVHMPDEQIPEQQSGPVEQVPLTATQHVPFTHVPVQQSPETVQVPPFTTQQVPLEQLPEQHWLLLVQVSRLGMHSQ